MANSNVVHPLKPLLAGMLIMVIAINVGIFNNVVTKNGFEHFAEEPDHALFFLPSGLKMPMNTLVNIGYFLVGIYWLITKRSVYFYEMFSWMAILYSIIQAVRTVLQRHGTAVMDQWCTTPFFALVVTQARTKIKGRQSSRTKEVAFSLLTSCLSYLLSLISSVGFEIQLAIYIFAVMMCVLQLQVVMGNGKTKKTLTKGVLCLVGFVVLKHFDLELGALSPIFRRFSGHFWSKICDFMQIHYVLKYFSEIDDNKPTQQKNK